VEVILATDDLGQKYEKRKLDIAARSGGDRRVYARIKEIECREFVESVLAANGQGHLRSDRIG
jgi:hypothetical protein